MHNILMFIYDGKVKTSCEDLGVPLSQKRGGQHRAGVGSALRRDGPGALVRAAALAVDNRRQDELRDSRIDRA